MSNKPKITLDPKFQYSELDNRHSAVIKKVTTQAKYIPQKFQIQKKPIDLIQRQKRELKKLGVSTTSSSSSPSSQHSDTNPHPKPSLAKPAPKPRPAIRHRAPLPSIEYSDSHLEILTRGKQLDLATVSKSGFSKQEIGLLALKTAIGSRRPNDENEELIFGQRVERKRDRRNAEVLKDCQSNKQLKALPHYKRQKISEQEPPADKEKTKENGTEENEEELKDGFEWLYWEKFRSKFMRFMESKVWKNWAKSSIRKEIRFREKKGGEEGEGEWSGWERGKMRIYKGERWLFCYWRKYGKLPRGGEDLAKEINMDLKSERKKKKKNKLQEEINWLQVKAKEILKEKEEKKKNKEKNLMLQKLDLI